VEEIVKVIVRVLFIFLSAVHIRREGFADLN
jgi:hypothetical protein